MYVRKSRTEDIPDIMRVFDEARKFMRRNGNMVQWTGGHPSEELVRQDIEQGVGYVICEDDEIYGAFAFIIGDDPTYEYIEDGEWLNSAPYGTIHRLGSDGRKNGLFTICYEFCKEIFPTIRTDTHEDNAPMLHIMEKHGLKRCGIIYVEDGTPRVAFCN